MDVVVYLHRSNGTVTLLGRRPTEDPRPYSYSNLALSVAITRASKLVIGKDCRLVNAVEDPLDRRRPLYQQAVPTIRYALCVTAARAHQTLPYLPPRYEGHVDGLAQARPDFAELQVASQTLQRLRRDTTLCEVARMPGGLCGV